MIEIRSRELGAGLLLLSREATLPKRGDKRLVPIRAVGAN